MDGATNRVSRVVVEGWHDAMWSCWECRGAFKDWVDEQGGIYDLSDRRLWERKALFRDWADGTRAIHVWGGGVVPDDPLGARDRIIVSWHNQRRRRSAVGACTDRPSVSQGDPEGGAEAAGTPDPD